MGEKRADPVVLLVDDDEMERFFIRQALEPAGFAIVEAEKWRRGAGVTRACDLDEYRQQADQASRRVPDDRERAAERDSHSLDFPTPAMSFPGRLSRGGASDSAVEDLTGLNSVARRNGSPTKTALSRALAELIDYGDLDAFLTELRVAKA